MSPDYITSFLVSPRRHAVRKYIIAMCAVSTLGTVSFSADRLESVENYLTVTEMHRAYHRLWERKLLDRDAIVQFINAPGGAGPETGISISRTTQGDNSTRRRFKLVVNETTSSLWSVVVARHEGISKPKRVEVKSCEIPLPESTALAVHHAWLIMLQQIDPVPDHLVLDSTHELFFARTSDGRVLRGQLPLNVHLGSNTKRLLEIANVLYRCCGASENDRTNDFQHIERLAADIASK